MSVDIQPMPSSSAGSPFQQTATPTSAPPSPAMSSPSTLAHDSTLLTTFDSSTNITDPHPKKPVLDADQDKLNSVLSAPHPSPSTTPATSIHKNVLTMSSLSEAGVPAPLPADGAARGAEHGVSPVINAFRSPYPHSPSYFVTVVPPDDFPMSPEVSQHERSRMQRGSLLPLYPTLGGQLWAISREFALPSLGGLMLYLSDDGRGNRGPRVGDAAWQALWARYFDEDDGPSTSAYKPQTAFNRSRRSSIVAGDSSADASATSAAHAADVSRSMLGEASSSRPNLPYLSSRPLPSPRVEALSFSRRDTSADWSPSSRSAGWSANVSSSAGHAALPFSPFPQLPILARVEWQIDSVKAPWWPAWVASRCAPRERPLHKTRKSLHLPNNLTLSQQDALDVRRDHDASDNEVDQDGEHKEDQQEDDRDQSQMPHTRNLESNASQPPYEHVETADAGPSAPRSVSPALSELAKHQAFTAVSAPTDPVIAHDEHQKSSPRSIAPSTSAQSLPHLDDGPQVPVEEDATSNEKPETDSINEHASERRSPSPSDEPLKSERASILSMSWPGSRRTSAASHASATARPTDASGAPDASPPIPSTAAESEQALAHRSLDIDNATTSHRDASDQSRTGYTEILDVNDALGRDTDDEGDSTGEPVLHARHGGYAALPDSPSSDVQESHRLPDLPSASDREQQRFSQVGFPLRHSFIVDAGDEAMWRDLHHHDMDPMTPEPREDTHTLPNEHHQTEPEEQAQQQMLAEERSSSFELIHKSDYDVATHQQTQPTSHACDTHAVAHGPQDLNHQQRFVQVDDFAHDAYYSPQRSKVARIQSWIGKTPTGRPNSSGAFDEDDFDQHADDQGLQLPAESDIDEVVGLWASKVRQDPHDIPHISGPTTASSGGEGEERARDEQDEVQIVERQHHTTDQRSGEVTGLAATAAPALSLLSPIHLDAAAFDGVRPQLGKLCAPAPPQLLSPTAVADAFNTPRAFPDQRSVSTPILQQHPPSSPASLAPPLDRKNSNASRRSSGDLSDTLQEMEKALQLLSPSCSPNPAVAHSPVPTARKMSSRDSLAYARSLSASVTPSPKWIARAKAATVKSRTHARRTFAVGGSPFDLGQVSPRPASTSAVSSSRARSPGLRAPLSASRLIEFAQAEATARQARTEIGDLESTGSGDTIGDDLDTEAAPSIVSLAAVEKQTTQESPSLVQSTLPLAKEVVQAPSKVEDEELDGAEHTTNKAKEPEMALGEPVEAVPSSLEARFEAAEPSHPSEAEAKAGEADETQGLSAFMTDDHDVGIASIQRFLRGKVVSAGESDASVLRDRTTSISDPHPDSSAAVTIIERSASLDHELRSASVSEQPTDQAETEARAAVESREAQSLKDEPASEPRWSRASYASDHLSPRHLSESAYSVNSTSPKRDRHHEVHTDSFTYRLSSEPTTMDTQLSRAGTDGEGLSVAGEVVKSYLSSSPSDEVFFTSSGPTRAPARAKDQQQKQQSKQPQNQSESAAIGTAEQDSGSESAQQQQQHLEETRRDEADEHHASYAVDAMKPTTITGSVPTLAYRFTSSPVHPEMLTIPGPLAGTHDGSLDEDEIRTMHEDTRAAVREALSQSTAHHVNIVPAVAPPAIAAVGGPLSPKSTSSPLSSPLSSHSSLGDHFRRRGSASSLNLTSTGGGSASNASSPNLNGQNAVLPAARRRPSKLNLDIDGLARSPPSAAVTASARRLPSTSPRSRFGQLPPSPSLHPSYKAAMSSPLSQSSSQMGLGSPRGKTFLPSLTSVTSLEGELT